ncbi:MAG: hypothetical protein DRH24_03965 [Deltaproteobacteria bacterium]|nr:MAG: hypothetical protein DRH24_03965 [Deltaproteobacteria bacterium]
MSRDFCAKGFPFLAWSDSFGEFWCGCGSDSEKVEADFGNHRWFFGIAMTIVNETNKDRSWEGFL